jgi:hypothetical protein
MDDLEKMLRELKDGFEKFKSNLNTSGQNLSDKDLDQLKKIGIESEKLKDIDPKLLQNSLNLLMEKLKASQKQFFNENNSKAQKLVNFQKRIDALNGMEIEADKETLRNFQREYLIEEMKNSADNCFHWDKTNCKGGVIAAHSIQRKGPLHLISERIDNRDQVIYFARSSNDNIWKADLIPIRESSTFRGFCDGHDKIFDPIEKLDYNGSDFQNFLHCYRSFAFSYFKVNETYSYPIELYEGLGNSLNSTLSALTNILENLGATKLDDFKSKGDFNITKDQLDSINALKFEKYGKLLNKYLQNKEYEELEYFSYQLDHLAPIVCSSWLRLHVELGNTFLIQNTGEIYSGNPVLITVFHSGDNKTVVLIARFKRDEITKLIFDQLRKLSDEKLEVKITSLIFDQVENFYLSPTFWNYLPETEKSKIGKELNRDRIEFPQMNNYESEINVFHSMHKLK